MCCIRSYVCAALPASVGTHIPNEPGSPLIPAYPSSPCDQRPHEGNYDLENTWHFAAEENRIDILQWLWDDYPNKELWSKNTTHGEHEDNVPENPLNKRSIDGYVLTINSSTRENVVYALVEGRVTRQNVESRRVIRRSGFVRSPVRCGSEPRISCESRFHVFANAGEAFARVQF